MRFIFGAVIASVAVATTTASAQVGYPPAQSPFIDIETRHGFTLLGGYFSAKRDPAKVAPQSGPMAGFMYEWRASGPVHLGMSVMSVNSQRLYLDPSKPISGRDLGTRSEPLYAADAFLSLALTGGRSWHNLIPMAGAGLGLVTNAKPADVGGFRFGTRFAFPMSAGVRWLPGGGRFELRADIKDWMYTIKYPQGYYASSTSGEAAILTPTTDASRWTHNFAMTVGGSYTFKW